MVPSAISTSRLGGACVVKVTVVLTNYASQMPHWKLTRDSDAVTFPLPTHGVCNSLVGLLRKQELYDKGLSSLFFSYGICIGPRNVSHDGAIVFVRLDRKVDISQCLDESRLLFAVLECHAERTLALHFVHSDVIGLDWQGAQTSFKFFMPSRRLNQSLQVSTVLCVGNDFDVSSV